MALQAILTTGWPDDPKDRLSATSLHGDAEQRGTGYQAFLGAELRKSDNPVIIPGLDRLFRRRTKHFQKIKKFVSNLFELSCSDQGPFDIKCKINLFAYAFLKGAKNFDLFLPVSEDNNGFKDKLRLWENQLADLENFERQGIPFPSDSPLRSEQYLALRRIIARPSATDERRTLATLLVSGPSSIEEISIDLELNYTLGQRTVGVFHDQAILERDSKGIYVITEDALPLVVFVLRETIGLDLQKQTLQMED